MDWETSTLPNDVETLQALVSSLRHTHLEQQQRLNEQQAKLQRQSSLIDQLVEQIKLARHKQFGVSSEQWSVDQMRLFNEAEAIVDREGGDGDDDQESDADMIAVPAHRRKRGGRKPLPPEWPRIEVVHELPESECICPHDGATLKVIDEVATEQLDIIPAQVRVIRHIRKKYACPCCDGTIKTAPMPNQPIPKSRVSPGLLAYVVINKFADALPLYRLC